MSTGAPSAKHELAREFVFFAPSVFAPALVGFLSIVLLTRLVEPAVYGRYALVISVATTVTSIGGDWLVPVAIHYHPVYEQEGHAHNLTASLLRMGIVIGAVACVVSLLLLKPTLPWAWVMPAIALTAAMIWSKTVSSILRAQLLTRRYSVASGLAAILGFSIGVALFLATDSAPNLIWGTAIATAIVVTFAGLHHIFLTSTPGPDSLPQWRTLLAFGIPIALTGIGGQALLLADRYIIAASQGDAAVGLYVPNYAMANRMIGLIFAPVFGAVYPLIARAWASEDRGRMLHLIELVHRAFAVIGGAAVAMFVLFYDPIARVAVGDDYRSAAWVLAVVAPATYLWFTGILFHQILEQSENTRAISYLVGITAVLNVGLNLVLVPKYGYPAAAWTTLGCYAGYCLLAYFWPKRTVGIQSKIPWDAYLRIALFGAIMASLTSVGVDELPIVGLLLVALAAMVAVLFVTQEPLLKSWRTLLSLRSGGGST